MPRSSPSHHSSALADRTQAAQRGASAPLAALVLLLALPLALSLNLSRAFGARAVPAPDLESAALDSLLSGSAISFAERSSPWVRALEAAREADQPRILARLSAHLRSESPEVSTRAAVLLGAAVASEALPPPSRGAAEAALVERLTLRQDMGVRWKVSADVVAARALDIAYGSSDKARGVQATLRELAHGAEPHPHLAVRVECAASALKLASASSAQPALTRGSEPETTAFLLAVLRAETPAQEDSPRTWPRMTTLAWVKTRAAEALAAWTATDNRFRPDGSWAHQVAEAARFEALLR